MRLGTMLAALVALAMAASCAEEYGDEGDLTWEEFKAMAWQDPETGVFIANGDELFEDEDALRALYEAWRTETVGDEVVGSSQQPLAINRVGGRDDRWSSSTALNLTYCVSQPGFGGNYSRVVSSMNSAAGAWEGGARVNFIHRSQFDGNCLGASSSQVVFRVLRTQGAPFLARAFFPSSSFGNRTVVIDQSSFGNVAPFTLTGILRHELGHTLGFRHEHTRPEAGTCFENSSWRALTSYDSSSVMHYPQCNGTNGGDLVLTSRDRSGAASVYGSP
jgi:serralysin